MKIKTTLGKITVFYSSQNHVEYVDYIENDLFMAIFYMIYTFLFGYNILDPFVPYIHNSTMKNPIIKAFQCVCLLTFSVLGRHFSTHHFIIFVFPKKIVFGFSCKLTWPIFRENKKISSFCHMQYLCR